MVKITLTLLRLSSALMRVRRC